MSEDRIKKLIAQIKEKSQSEYLLKEEFNTTRYGFFMDVLDIAVEDTQLFSAIFDEFYKEQTAAFIKHLDCMNEKQVHMIADDVMNDPNKQTSATIPSLLSNEFIKDGRYDVLFALLCMSKNVNIQQIGKFIDERTTDEDFKFVLEFAKKDRDKDLDYRKTDVDVLYLIGHKHVVGIKVNALTDLACKNLNFSEFMEYANNEKVIGKNYNKCVETVKMTNSVENLSSLAINSKTNKAQFNALLNCICKIDHTITQFDSILTHATPEYLTEENITKIVEKMKSSESEEDVKYVMENERITGEHFSTMIDTYLNLFRKGKLEIYTPETIDLGKFEGENLRKFVLAVSESRCPDMLYKIAISDKITGENYEILLDRLCQLKNSYYLRYLADNTKTTDKNFDKIFNIISELGDTKFLELAYSDRVQEQYFNQIFDHFMDKGDDLRDFRELAKNEKTTYEQFCKLLEKMKNFEFDAFLRAMKDFLKHF